MYSQFNNATKSFFVGRRRGRTDAQMYDMRHTVWRMMHIVQSGTRAPQSRPLNEEHSFLFYEPKNNNWNWNLSIWYYAMLSAHMELYHRVECLPGHRITFHAAPTAPQRRLPRTIVKRLCVSRSHDFSRFLSYCFSSLATFGWSRRNFMALAALVRMDFWESYAKHLFGRCPEVSLFMNTLKNPNFVASLLSL